VTGKIRPWIFGPATAAARRDRAERAGSAARGYPRSANLDDPSGNAVALAATRALLNVQTRAEAAQVLHTAVHDLGGAIVPARLAGDDAIPVDVSLGVGEPRLVVADQLDMAACAWRSTCRCLSRDAQHAAAQFEPARPPAGGAPVRDEQPSTTTGDGYFDALSAQTSEQRQPSWPWPWTRGETTHALIRDVLVPAQRKIGELWFSGAWNVADEHAASAVAEQALTLVAAPRIRRSSRSTVGGSTAGRRQ
jgi:hypothetical protein